MVVPKPTLLHPSAVVIEQIDDYSGTVAEVPSLSSMWVGDVVLFSTPSEIEFEEDGNTYRIIQERDVYGWYTRVPRAEPITL